METIWKSWNATLLRSEVSNSTDAPSTLFSGFRTTLNKPQGSLDTFDKLLDEIQRKANLTITLDTIDQTSEKAFQVFEEPRPDWLSFRIGKYFSLWPKA